MKKIDKYDLPSLIKARKRSKSDTLNLRENFVIADYLKNLGQNKFYHIKTYGCQANILDTETMRGILALMGYKESEDETKADVILINTCAVRQNAEDKVYGVIGRLKHLKTTNPDLVIGLCGCMAQEEEVVDIILKKYPQVDLIFGTHNITSLPRLLYEVNFTKEKVVEVFSKEGDVVESLPANRFLKHKAWVNIMYGCDKFCTYCIVPYTRGKERSRLKDDILAEIIALKQEGYKEVCLLGQNVNAYGKDLKIGYEFSNLLEDVAKTGIERIRFTTSHPWDFNDEMIRVIAENDNIMPFIHLPMQSGNDLVLRRMGRRYTSKDYRELFDKIKTAIPNCAFSTDIIVGFPQESEEAFEDTLKMVDYCKYDNAYTFIYSKREGTPAAKMGDDISLEVKEERLKKLNEKVTYYANLNNQKYMDQIVEVLVDGPSKKNKEVFSGYSRENKLVNFTGKDIQTGSIVKVKITKCLSWSLNGEIVE